MTLVDLSESRSRSKAVLAVVVATMSTGMLIAVTLPWLSVAKALATSVLWVTLLAVMFVAGRSRRVRFDSGKRCVIVEWRNFALARRRKEIPLSRFGSVLSYYAIGESHGNWVCLIEHAGDRGLHIAAFDSAWKPRSFWDLVPPLIEAEGARTLRSRLCSTLGLRDAGFVPVRWPLKESK